MHEAYRPIIDDGRGSLPADRSHELMVSILGLRRPFGDLLQRDASVPLLLLPGRGEVAFRCAEACCKLIPPTISSALVAALTVAVSLRWLEDRTNLVLDHHGEPAVVLQIDHQQYVSLSDIFRLRDTRADETVTFGPSDCRFEHKGAEGFRDKQQAQKD